MKQITVHVDANAHGLTKMYQSKPSHAEAGKIKVRFTKPHTIQERTIDDIADLLTHGVTIQPGVTPFSAASREKGYKGTNKADFTRQTLFMNDIDNDTNDPLAPGDVVNDLALYNLRPAFMYETFSSTEEKIRFRYALVCDEEITDKNERDRIARAIVYMYDAEADQTCTNADRIFFGTNKGLIDAFTDFEAVCKKSDLLALADALGIPDNPEESEKPEKHTGAQGDVLSDFADPEGDVDAFITDRLNLARKAKNGKKFIDLYDRGDWQKHHYKSQSEADQALCAMLAFWLNADPELIEQAVRGSALYDEKWERDKYRENTIAKGIDICPECYQEHQNTGRPGRPSKPRLTIAAFDAILQNIGFSVRYNVITGRYDTAGRTPEGRTPSLDDLTTYLQDLLADDYKSVSIKLLEQYVVFLGREHQYNPVLEWLQTVTWDGVDRIQQVYDLLGITDDELSKTLVYKWLLQAVALLFNGESDQKPFGADGCLTLKGEQGCGKTSFFRHIGLQWFGEGKAIDNRDKDTKRRVVTKWITELGEVETTLKSDIEDLKNFISAREDEYRLPYGRSDVLQPRRASMCATCNSDRYLIDTTGNRRWWTVPIDRMIPWADINALDASQLWAQIYAIVAPLPYDQKGDCFRLTEAERTLLAIRNGDFEKGTKGQDEVADILARADRDGLKWQDITIADFKGYWSVLRPYTVQQIGVALKRCGILTEKVRRGDRQGRFARLPVPAYISDQL